MMITVMQSVGFTTEEILEGSQAIIDIMKELPPIGMNEIEMIRNNSSLNRFQKWRLVRKIRRLMNESSD